SRFRSLVGAKFASISLAAAIYSRIQRDWDSCAVWRGMGMAASAIANPLCTLAWLGDNRSFARIPAYQRAAAHGGSGDRAVGNPRSGGHRSVDKGTNKA